jgi:hypothetical protein
VFAAWLKVMEGCPVEAQPSLQRGFLERFIPENQRERVIQALSKKGMQFEEQPTTAEKEQALADATTTRSSLLIATHLLAFCVGLAISLLLAKMLTPP